MDKDLTLTLPLEENMIHWMEFDDVLKKPVWKSKPKEVVKPLPPPLLNLNALERKAELEAKVELEEEAKEDSNAKRSPYDFKARAYQLTIFDEKESGIYDKVVDYLEGLKLCDYGLSCWEICPKTKRKHWHIYVHFKNSVKLSARKCFYSHLELVRGTVDDNIHYIKKTGKHKDAWNDDPANHQNLAEWGTIPAERGGGLTGAALMEMSTREVIEYDPRCHQAHLRARELLVNPADIDIDDWKKDVKVFYIQGPSGIGKSERAKDMVRERYPPGQRLINEVKYENNFWMGVDSAKVAIYDDWRSSHMKASEFINFIDYNKHNLNVKGGHKRNNYELIIITSVERFDEIYRFTQGEPRLQWERRVEVIDMYALPKESANISLD